MNFIIDGHEDLAFESLAHHRDTTQSVAKIRQAEPQNRDNQATLGWPEMQKGNVALIFSTLFAEPPAHWEFPKRTGINFETAEEFHQTMQIQLDFYERWQEQHPDKFKLIPDYQTLSTHIDLWQDDPMQAEESTRPVGLIPLLEGAEELRSFADLDEYYERGLRIVGPVWAGGRWCGGTYSPNTMRFTPEGKQLLEILAEKKFILDLSHMNTISANEAMDSYQGVVIASHCNCRALLRNQENERQFTDETIAHLVDRDGVVGVIPFNDFLDGNWGNGQPRERVTLDHLAQHIDHICQIAGNAEHVAIGSDLDGGFGYPNIPLEMNDVSDLKKLEQILQQRGYTEEDIRKIFHGNWLRVLKRGLP